ncbi:OstA family protein [Dinoroseobacter shibae DFL 12 = DSM 16493]|jgi:lipopolysaccharide export system protein LptA|uniref:OstA family protein n=1 Tax=Dinoroseobacter shibae (strain DSM 16493 / NCIMB 14021 / DFL 12) TaxID=398580 RepID=A8LQ79_DINSH|nr:MULTISPECIES: lipopolysaccharide transport periplasmic protein LptA [Dinoroseobacter]ABV95319.1 OstA family protein [Dinoroseobacter shibae DFL 12 = DSM 16493]MDD9717138.1 lipopolysaccharide transport periplasmic protein LptA [Dinoroseobacter sp. PD6]URF46724.1 lipopolysaccharide transport periplasmic protein LptA [Dinoroseobacter shibae]URF51035.1 lipopolysaccharide transport periplasmic protein LptA [Dinoroseobacter shibae]
MVDFRRIAMCTALALGLGLPLPAPVWAQGSQVALGTARVDRDAPVEIDADSLSVNQQNGSAVFSGNVQVTQGALRLEADEVTVSYDPGSDTTASEIREVRAEGNVLMVSGPDAAESQSAVYTPASNEIRLSGDVLLSQGPVVIAGDALVVDLLTGIGEMEGRVRTVLQPE